MMATLQFQRATKERIKLRMAIFGPSGAGKTYTSLRIATGMGGKIAVIDTERGSASRYADRFEYDVLELPQNDIETYVAAMAAAHEYDVLIIDSLSHAWQALLEEVDQLARAKYQGNTWSAWSMGTPKQRGFVDALLRYPGHVIATMRSKTEWALDQDERTKKSKPVRVGLAPEQGKGIEYEFDILLELNTEHCAAVIKDRTGRFQDRIIEKPGESFGKEIVAWLSEGADPQDGDQHEQEKQGQPPSENKSTTNGDGDKPKPSKVRPWEPEMTRAMIAKKIAQINDMRNASRDKTNLTAGRLNDLFGNKPRDQRDQLRHSLLMYLLDTDTTKELTVGQCEALLAWSSDTIVEDGKTNWLPNEDAVSEAAKIVAEYEREHGQNGIDWGQVPEVIQPHEIANFASGIDQ